MRVPPLPKRSASLAAQLSARLQLEHACGVEVIPSAALRVGTTRAPADDAAGRLQRLRAEAERCTRCSLCRTRTHLVFGEGDPRARLVLVGEAPGRDEDRTGRPFIGAAGQLLTKILAAVHLTREEVYICNVLKDRPPDNRVPLPEEIEACRPFLFAQLELIQPRLICTLGAVATKTLLGTREPLMQLRGRVHEWRNIPVIPTLHPAYLLRNPPAKRLVWNDMKTIRDLLKENT